MTGPLGVRDALVLSPMVDVTDAAFRSIASEWGADITCSEMAAAVGIVRGNPKTWRLVAPWPGESPYGVQLMGREELADAARALVDRHAPDFIDINLGCPSPHILRSQAGGFLLRDPRLVGRMVAATVDAVAPTPVSIKLRKGHDDEHETYLEVAQEAQDAGASWCTLHGRTVEQGYAGRADWHAIARLVDQLDIPVIGNGDLRTPEDVIRMRDETACSGFFIARAAMHDPTVFRRMRQALDDQPVDEAPPLRQRLQILDAYLERAATLGDIPIPVLKRQATRFVQGVRGARAVRAAIQSAATAEEVAKRLHSLEVA